MALLRCYRCIFVIVFAQSSSLFKLMRKFLEMYATGQSLGADTCCRFIAATLLSVPEARTTHSNLVPILMPIYDRTMYNQII